MVVVVVVVAVAAVVVVWGRRTWGACCSKGGLLVGFGGVVPCAVLCTFKGGEWLTLGCMLLV